MITRLALIASQFVATGLLAIISPANAQKADGEGGAIANLPALVGDYFVLSSKEVGRKYYIYVRLPVNYEDNPNHRYPVVYLLDGDSTFPMLAPMHLFMHYDDQMPEAVLVGIAYGGFTPTFNKRHIDFRMTLEDGKPGGASQFLKMLENELVPRIDASYRTDPARRIIVGQSLGGSAVLQAAWLKPGLFWGHIASNPGRESDTKLLFGMDLPPPKMRRDGYVIVTSGSNDRHYLREIALKWRDFVSSRGDLPWDTRFVNIPGGTHAADLGNAYRAAMRIMFDRPPSTGNQFPD